MSSEEVVADLSNNAGTDGVEESTAPTNGESNNNYSGKNPRKPREPNVPIEELYDLSKPIPKVDKPNKEQNDKEIQEITDAIEALKVEKDQLQAKIDAAKADPDGKSSLQESRTKLTELKAKKGILIEEKKALRAQLDSIKNQTDKLIKDRKDVRSNIKFESVEDIDKEIAKLKRMQETTTMKLTDEKRLIKEMDALQASKKYINEIKAKDTSIDNTKEQRKNINDLVKIKDKEIDDLTKQIEELNNALKAVNEKDSEKRDAFQALIKEREELKKQFTAKIGERDAARDAFRKANNEWFNYQRAIRAQKKIQYEAEKTKREAEKAAYLAKIEAEEAKKIPYEEEQALCDFLADYLERTYLKKNVDSDKAMDKKKDDIIAVKDNPFAGMKAIGKKDEEEETYFSTGKSKKKRERQKKGPEAGPFTLSVDTFEQFGLLQLSPPVSIDQVEASVKELREKKVWYQQQPRGSVPTAAEIRKAALKERPQRDAAANVSVTTKKGASGKGFNLSNDDFAPLGTGSTSANAGASLWGQQTGKTSAAEDDAAPVEESLVENGIGE